MKRFHQQEVIVRAMSREMRLRAVGVAAAVGVVFTALSGRLAVVQIAEHTLWQERATEQQLAEHKITDKRGTVTDCHGEVLAQSTEATSVLILPSEIPDEATRERIAAELPPLLQVDAERLKKQLKKTGSRCEIAAVCVTDTVREAFTAWVAERGYASLFRVVQDYRRSYPQGTLLSSVLGFTGTDNTGLEGLEAKYNAELAGKAGCVMITQNGRGDAYPTALQYETTVDAEEGNSLTLTVDATVQRITEKHLEAALAETGAANRVSAIVMDVKTGGVLAMATKGDYDPNTPRVLTQPTEAARIALLAGEERAAALTEALQKQWKNKAISEFYEPGSVFKIFTASAALQEGLVSEASHFYCNGTFTMPGVRTMKCHVYPRSHGDQSLAEAISHSCNPAFMRIGSLLGTTRFPQYHALFGFTERTGIDLLGEARVTPSLYHTAEAITAVDVATSSIGQTFKVTPIQLITGVCAVAGGGVLRQPYLVSRVTDRNGKTVKETVPTVRRRVLSRETAARICTMLEGVVDGGGAKNAYVAGYRVAGKTGTSEKTDQKVTDGARRDVVASFCGFAPADDPRIAVLVMIDEPKTAIRYGGLLAAPVAQKIFAEVLPYLQVEAVYSEKELKAMQATAPDTVGMTTSQATAQLQAAGLSARIVGTGTQVIAQLPDSGTALLRGGTIVLYTDGERPRETAIPAVTGLSLSEANRRLTDAGFTVCVRGYVPTAAGQIREQAATVAAQEPAEGTALPGTTVTIQLRYQDATE